MSILILTAVPRAYTFEIIRKRLAGAIILSVMYGYDVRPKDDYFVQLVESTRPAFGIGLSPKWLVNSFPALRHIPSWFPGASFKQYASSINRKIVETQEATYKYAMTTSVRLMMLMPVIYVNCQSLYFVRVRREMRTRPLFAIYPTTILRQNSWLS